MDSFLTYCFPGSTTGDAKGMDSASSITHGITNDEEDCHLHQLIPKNVGILTSYVFTPIVSLMKSNQRVQTNEADARRNYVQQSAQPNREQDARDQDTYTPAAECDIAIQNMETTIMASTLPIDAGTAFQLFFLDNQFCEGTLSPDKEIHVGEWQPTDTSVPNTDPTSATRSLASTEKFEKFRKVTHTRVAKTKVGVSVDVECTQVHRYRTTMVGTTFDQALVSTVLSMEARSIQCIDCIDVESRVVLRRIDDCSCHIEVGMNVNFVKSSWLLLSPMKSFLKKKAISQGQKAMRKWKKQALEVLAERQSGKKNFGLIGNQELTRHNKKTEMPCLPVVSKQEATCTTDKDEATTIGGDLKKNKDEEQHHLHEIIPTNMARLASVVFAPIVSTLKHYWRTKFSKNIPDAPIKPEKEVAQPRHEKTAPRTCEDAKMQPRGKTSASTTAPLTVPGFVINNRETRIFTTTFASLCRRC